jgi:hypothetical protein
MQILAGLRSIITHENPTAKTVLLQGFLVFLGEWINPKTRRRRTSHRVIGQYFTGIHGLQRKILFENQGRKMHHFWWSATVEFRGSLPTVSLTIISRDLLDKKLLKFRGVVLREDVLLVCGGHA